MAGSLLSGGGLEFKYRVCYEGVGERALRRLL